jgi:PAS domain S-box-containing protein
MTSEIFYGEEKFKALFEYATEGILLVNQSGKIILANPASEKLFGYENGELQGNAIELLIPQRFAHNHSAHRDKFNSNPHPRTMGIGMDLYGKKKNGEEFSVEVSLSPLETSSEKFVIAFIVDITARKKNEDHIKKQKQELEVLTKDLEKRVKDRTMILEEALHQLEKSREELSIALEKEKELNEMKSRFVSMASHEFRTPLATILSSVTLISKYREQDDRENEIRHIERVKSSVSHMTDILNDMLSISKLEEGKITAVLERFDVIEFVKQIVTELQAVAKKGQLIIYNHDGHREVHLDKKILRNIFFNLISNAIKFSPENETIDVTTQVSGIQLRLTVKDHGIGISEEDKEHLFERFFRGHNATNIQGTGLGLNIVAKYLEILNGDINFDSKVGEGTTFIIQLPNNIIQ